MATAQKRIMSPWQHALFWSGAALLFVGFVWLFKSVLLPFVLGLGIAYFLDPLVKKLADWRVPRWAAAALILSVFILALGGILAIILPMALKQAELLICTLPDYIDWAYDQLAPYIGWLENQLGNGSLNSIQDAVQKNAGTALSVGGGVLAGLATGGQALIGFVSTLVITPIVAFFMMMEWPKIKRWFYGLMPRTHETTIRGLLSEIDKKVAGFIRGQVSVAFILGIMYAVALTIAGLKFGFLIGLAAGLLSIIPLVGSTVGLLVSVIVAWFQSGELSYVAIIAAIFLTGQFIEGNILSPRLLGKSVGLHPLWVFFGLLAGGSLFGIVGMLLAVPVTTAIGVLASFAISRYKASPYYNAPPATGGTAASEDAIAAQNALPAPDAIASKDRAAPEDAPK